MEVGFWHGALSDSYEKQANEQGFTLGDKAQMFDEIKSAYDTLMYYKLLTDSQANSVYNKIQKQLVKNLKPMDDKKQIM